VTVAVVARDLMVATRISDAGSRVGVEVRRVDHPSQLPEIAQVGLVLVDWGARDPDWADALLAWGSGSGQSGRGRVILFGPHTDLAAHAAARAAGLGPMLARSKLFTDLPALLAASGGAP
jgi:hypothetical protein